MANLIITVIAIALVAIASLMGAYYGGSAFLNNQSAANASTVLNQGQQLSGAWNAYLSDNLNTPPAAGALSVLVVNNYLAQIPTTPAGPGNAVSKSMAVTLNANGHYFAYADMGAGGATSPGTSADNNSSACDRIIKTAVGGTGTTGNGTMGTGTLGTIYNTSTSGNGTFGCAYVAAGVSAPTVGGTAIAANHYVMEYKLQ